MSKKSRVIEYKIEHESITNVYTLYSIVHTYLGGVAKNYICSGELAYVERIKQTLEIG